MTKTARDKTIANYIPLAKEISRCYRPMNGMDRQDLEQEAMLALVEAADRLLSDEHAKDYITKFINSRMKDIARVEKRHPQHGALAISIDGMADDDR